jgi:hypothetical protein
MAPPVHTSCRCLGMREYSSIMCEPCSLTVATKYLFIHPHRYLWVTRRHQSPPEQGDGVQSHVMHDSTGALPIREAGSGAAGRVAVLEPSRAGRRGPDPWDAWRHQRPPKRGGQVQYRGICGNAWWHDLLPALALSLYAGVPGL